MKWLLPVWWQHLANNNIPMFPNVERYMDINRKIINIAFAVSASFVLSDHLGFTAGVAKEMIFL